VDSIRTEAPSREKTLFNLLLKEPIMNTKSIFIATLFAASSSFAFAAEPASAAANTNADAPVQIAQAAPSQMPGRTMGTRTAKPAAGKDCFVGYSEASSSTVCPSADSRTRAEVRTETLQWLATRGNRNSDSIYFGSAQ
jgi:hypothetical protein